MIRGAATAERYGRLRRRYLSLALGELAAAAIFALAAPSLEFIAADDSATALWCALCPLLIILVQAGIYWLISRSRIPAPLPRSAAVVYRSLRIINPLLLIAAAVGVILSWPGASLSAVLIIGVWLLAALEYINYFLVRLSYPWTSWASQIGRWSTPRLVRDLRAAR